MFVSVKVFASCFRSPPFLLLWLFIGLPPSLPPLRRIVSSSSFNLFVCSSTEAEGPLHLFWSGGRVNRGAPKGLVGPVATRPDPQTWPSSPLAAAKTREGALGGTCLPLLTHPPSPGFDAWFKMVMRCHVGSLAWRPVEGVAGPKGGRGLGFFLNFY